MRYIVFFFIDSRGIIRNTYKRANACKTDLAGASNDRNKPGKRWSWRAMELACLQTRLRQLSAAKLVKRRDEWNGGCDLKVLGGTLSFTRLRMSGRFM